jgi:hypothetical protein
MSLLFVWLKRGLTTLIREFRATASFMVFVFTECAGHCLLEAGYVKVAATLYFSFIELNQV